MKKLYILLLIFFINTPVFATHWVQIDKKLYADETSNKIVRISNTNTKTNFSNKDGAHELIIKWVNDESSIFKDIETSYNRKIGYLQSKIIVSCKENTLSILSASYYDLFDQLITTQNNKENWYAITPGSIGDGVYQYACLGRNAVYPDESILNINK